MSKELYTKLETFSTTEICDAIGVFHAMDYTMKPVIPTGTVAGPAVTLDLPLGESAAVVDVIRHLKEGDILVIAGRDARNSACWGDQRSAYAKIINAKAVVVDGAVRDLPGLREQGFPVFARAVCSGAAQKTGVGRMNVSVSCAGVSVSPGDIIMGDENGVIMLKEDEAEQAMEKALEKREKEEMLLNEFPGNRQIFRGQ